MPTQNYTLYQGPLRKIFSVVGASVIIYTHGLGVETETLDIGLAREAWKTLKSLGWTENNSF